MCSHETRLVASVLTTGLAAENDESESKIKPRSKTLKRVRHDRVAFNKRAIKSDGCVMCACAYVHSRSSIKSTTSVSLECAWVSASGLIAWITSRPKEIYDTLSLDGMHLLTPTLSLLPSSDEVFRDHAPSVSGGAEGSS